MPLATMILALVVFIVALVPAPVVFRARFIVVLALVV